MMFENSPYSSNISSRRESLEIPEEEESSSSGCGVGSLMSYESDSYLNSVMNPTTTKIKKKKKKKRLMSSLSCATFKDIYTLTHQVLGEGSYGKVVTCINNFTDTEYAVKIISKSSWYYSRGKVLKEVELYYLCQGQQEIIQLIEFFEEDDAFYLIFEKAYGGPLLDQIQKRNKFEESEACAIIKDLAIALRFLHNKGIAHRDIKPENILCVNSNSPLPVKLCDFDLCSAVYNTITTPRLTSPVGSAEYMAPEVVEAFIGRRRFDDFYDDEDDEEELSYDKRCDMWSLGVLLYILLVGYMPFSSGNCSDPECMWNRGGECLECQDRLFNSIKYGKLSFPEPQWKGISSEAKDLISKLLVKNPSQRLDAVDVLEHPWILNEGKIPTTTTTTDVVESSAVSSLKSSLPNTNNIGKSNFSKRTFSQNPFQRRQREMKRQTSMIFTEEFDYRCQL